MLGRKHVIEQKRPAEGNRRALDNKCAKIGTFTAPTYNRCRMLYVEVLHVERIVFNELAACFNVFAHQGCEDGFSFRQIFEFD